MDGSYAPLDTPSVEKARWFRLIPIAMVIYIISFMDRTNIGYAFAGIGRDFHVGKAAEGAAGGIFFIGYVLLQIPGGWLAEHWSAKKFIAVMIVLLGHHGGAVRRGEQLHRVTDGPVLPRRGRGRHLAGDAGADQPLVPGARTRPGVSFWMANLAISSIITQPLSGWIVSVADWRALFYIEGALPFLIALPLWLLFVKDTPRQASWCSAGRARLHRSLAGARPCA